MSPSTGHRSPRRWRALKETHWYSAQLLSRFERCVANAIRSAGKLLSLHRQRSRIEHQRDRQMCAATAGCLPSSEQMAVGRVQHPSTNSPPLHPKGMGLVRTDRDTMSDDVVLRQFLRLKPMPLDDDAAPSARAAAQQYGTGRRARKPLAVRDVDECDVTRVRKAQGAIVALRQRSVKHQRHRLSADSSSTRPPSRGSGSGNAVQTGDQGKIRDHQCCDACT